MATENTNVQGSQEQSQSEAPQESQLESCLKELVDLINRTFPDSKDSVKVDEKCPTDICVYLTFDDGPYNPATPNVLNILKERGVVATFFLNANHWNGDAKSKYDILKRIQNEGHPIGNHGYDHDPMTRKGYNTSKTADVKSDFDRITKEFQELFTANGDVFPGFSSARLPGDGRYMSDYTKMITSEVKLAHIAWDFEFAPNGVFKHVSNKNWQGVDGVAATSPSFPKNEDIILLHDHHWKEKADLLGRLIDKLKEKATIVSLIPLPSGHRQILYA